jgi:hypothetical protein
MTGSTAAEGDNPVLSQRARVLITLSSVTGLLALVGWLFWQQDVRYMLPTPRPAGLVQPPVGAILPVESWLARAGVAPRGRPVLLHVLNPECPCSRFNADHIRRLVKGFGDRVEVIGLVQVAAGSSPEQAASARNTAAGLELGVPLLVDEGGEIARAAGVYSTPQAVIVDGRGALVYRGNYNTARYHVDPRTEFARLALESLVGSGRVFTDPGGPAYGCELPGAHGATSARAEAVSR